MSSLLRCFTPIARKRTLASDSTVASTSAYRPRRIKRALLLRALRWLSAARLCLVLRRALGLQLLRVDERRAGGERSGDHHVDVGTEGLGHLPAVVHLDGRLL